MMKCWRHEGRHYKKLTPMIVLHRIILDKFQKQFWEDYYRLLNYCQQPTVKEKLRSEIKFDKLFSSLIGYHALDQRIAKTQAEKAGLLLALKYPKMPLHNNASELGVCQRVRKRDVSFGPRTEDGVKSWDTFATLEQTAKLLGVSACFYRYLVDRISGSNQILPLADRVSSMVIDLNLGWFFPKS